MLAPSDGLMYQPNNLQVSGAQFDLCLRTFARKFSNIDFCLKILPLKDDELVMSEMQKMKGHQLCFRENMPGRTPKSEY